MELIVLDIIGTIAFSISGYIIGVKNNLDILGISIVTFFSAFGGGVVRDLLVDRTPFIFAESYPLIVTVIVIILSILFKTHTKEKLEESKIFVLSDTIGLSIFAYSGAMIGMQYNFNFMGVIFLSLLTANGGGVIRDIVLNKTPFVLEGGFYGTIALLIGVVVFFLYSILTPMLTTIILSMGVIVRLIAIKYNWYLPKINT